MSIMLCIYFAIQGKKGNSTQYKMTDIKRVRDERVKWSM